MTTLQQPCIATRIRCNQASAPTRQEYTQAYNAPKGVAANAIFFVLLQGITNHNPFIHKHATTH